MIRNANDQNVLELAAALIGRGEVIGFPTETVYGLAASALNENAVRKIFEIKGRSLKDPLIVHVAQVSDVHQIAKVEDETQFKTLAESFWPGPLTLVLPKKENVPSVVTAGLSTVAIRVPQHPVAQKLLKLTGPLAAPSANRFQKLSPTTAQAVFDELGAKVPLIIDAGPCVVGVESTILKLGKKPLLLRPGGISKEKIEAVIGSVSIAANAEKESILQAPGMMSFHYAPTKPLHVFAPHALRVHIDLDPVGIRDWALVCFSEKDAEPFRGVGFKDIAVLSAEGNLEQAAQSFFTTLRRLDAGPFNKIAALLFPNEGLGVAINDRLQKAQHG